MLTFDQQGFWMIQLGQVLGVIDEHAQPFINLVFSMTSFVPEDLEIILNQFTALGDIFCCLHLIPS
jgi:phage-related protein